MFGFGKKVEAAKQARVMFNRSGVMFSWSKSDGSLLDLAEQHGLSPVSSCRSGNCGSCTTKLLSGDVFYEQATGADLAKGEVLLCSAVPAAEKGQLVVNISIDL
ncbi:MAG: 2Fe-2S iron-sulfur cluster binding domain-containing protein [Psychromonas sp.]|nr:2Fe-2S iron-sulfur cluster binding domain-containing protein [Alteromonadales bacterium]MCP5079801.1 2Fe-2S iron-sulfur cluster binding domain-containing protein [Psychromonas sp.]